MSQHDRILTLLKKSGRHGITSIGAIRDIGVLNLPGRISELIAKGYKIRKEAIEVSNRYGEVVRVNRYSLDRRQSCSTTETKGSRNLKQK